MTVFHICSFDPSEPRGLDEAVYRRIEELRTMLEEGIIGEGQKQNVDAILQHYREGKLTVEEGKVSYWKGGVIMRGLGDPIEELMRQKEDWEEQGWPGPTWEEGVCLFIFISIIFFFFFYDFSC